MDISRKSAICHMRFVPNMLYLFCSKFNNAGPKDASIDLTPFQGLSGTSMSSKTPEDLEDM